MEVGIAEKVRRIALYYLRLIGYAASAKPKIFHILWNNKFEAVDRTLLMLYYRAFGKRIVLTAHNVNAAKRDASDSFFNRLTLRIQYRLAHHIFVHTEQMKRELIEGFNPPADRVSVIPFGINNSLPDTSLTAREAKERLGLRNEDKALLFFGRITPYKGLEYLVSALRDLRTHDKGFRLVIAGRPDRCEEYWSRLRGGIEEEIKRGDILLNAGFIPDHEVEVYFKAADALVLPYRDIYQSGVLFLGQGFGLPVLAADVGSLKDEIVDGVNGLTFRPEDPADLARAIEQHFAGDLYRHLDKRRAGIKAIATQRHSWDVVGEMTTSVYAKLMQGYRKARNFKRDASAPSLDADARP